jgi:acetylornithine deacetylase/succinyl-diaminopimelate desuccinylase-like protein
MAGALEVLVLRFLIALAAAFALALGAPESGQGPASVAADPIAREIFKELIEINTTDSSGSTTRAAEAMAARLRAAGFPASDMQVIGPNARKGNLVMRMRGSDKGHPILLLAHTDVVEARREDWTMDPFTFVERDGYFYGRGTTDMKDMAAAWVTALIRFTREGFTPACDLILALTADEEGGDSNGVAWLLANHRDLIDAGFCLTEGGGGEIQNGRYVVYDVAAAEKVYLDFLLEVKNKGGHSSLPTKDNAIYELADGLARLSRFDFPVRLNEVTRRFFERTARLQKGEVAADMKAVAMGTSNADAVRRLSKSPYYNAMMRTTCVATRLEGGHADNALPQSARALVNCRILPDDSPAEVRATLARVLGSRITLTQKGQPEPSPPSPLTPEVMRAMDAQVTAMWPGVPVVPVMMTGASDARLLRRAGIPTYGLGLWEDVDDIRAHGEDERIGVRQFDEEVEFLYRLVKMLAGPPAGS